MFPVAQAGAFGVGEAFSIAGAIGQSQANKGYYQSQQNIAALEGQANQQNYQLQELTFNRSKLQALRNAQQAGSIARAAATGSGAQFGSAAGGAQGGIMGEYGTNVTAISQNEQTANALYTINQGITTQKEAAAGYQEKAATWAGLSSIGSSLAGSSKGLGELFPNSMFS
jgi:hypothetical protein